MKVSGRVGEAGRPRLLAVAGVPAMDLGFTARILKEDGTFIAHVPELDVSS